MSFLPNTFCEEELLAHSTTVDGRATKHTGTTLDLLVWVQWPSGPGLGFLDCKMKPVRVEGSYGAHTEHLGQGWQEFHST